MPDRLFGEPVGARVAMQHASHSMCSGFSDHRASVVLSIARVHDDRHSRLMGQLELCRKGTPLLEPRGIVVMVIQPALSDRHRAV
jgi:hypothetical protein